MSKHRDFMPRWGNEIADDYQYCRVPGYVLRNYHNCISAVDVTDKKGKVKIKRGQVVGLTMQDMMFVIHVMAFKYDAPEGKASPGLATIAEYTGLHITSVRRIKQKLIAYGLLSVNHEAGKPDIYVFSGLHDQCVRLEQSLSPIEGVEVTPSKSASTRKSARGWASKSARGVLAESLDEELEPKPTKKSSTRKRAADPFYDAISQVWGINAGGWIGNLKSMMLGTAKRGEWERCNFNPPVSDPNEILAFDKYMQQRMVEKKVTDKPTACVTIQRWFYDFRREGVKPVLSVLDGLRLVS
jgi:hypothetical protein